MVDLSSSQHVSLPEGNLSRMSWQGKVRLEWPKDSQDNIGCISAVSDTRRWVKIWELGNHRCLSKTSTLQVLICTIDTSYHPYRIQWLCSPYNFGDEHPSIPAILMNPFPGAANATSADLRARRELEESKHLLEEKRALRTQWVGSICGHLRPCWKILKISGRYLAIGFHEVLIQKIINQNTQQSNTVRVKRWS